MAVFDDILNSVPVEDRAILAKYPALKQSMDTLEINYARATERVGQWNSWAQENWDPEAGMTRKERELHDQIAELQAQVTAAPTRTAADQTALAALKQELTEKVEAATRAVEGQHRFWGWAAPRILTHQHEFGEVLDPNKVIEYMQVNKVMDPDAAYDKMMAARRAEIQQQKQADLDKKHQEEIQAAEQRGREAAAREAAMGPQGMLPTDSSGGIVGVSAQMDRPAAISDDVKARMAEAKPGTGSLANLGYELYRRGAFQQQQQ